MSFRLTHSDKILKPSDYRSVFKNGKITKGVFWQVVARRTNAPARLGLAISKKVHKLAVKRNRYKRIARESFRIHKDALNNWEFVVMVKSTKQPTQQTAITEDLLSVLHTIVKN